MAFERRWQLPVYFQLRWKEIVGKLESVLSRPPGDTSSTRSGFFSQYTYAVTYNFQPPFYPPIDDDGFKTPQAYATFVAAQSCWAPEVFIPELGHRFWRLTLQVRTCFIILFEFIFNCLLSDPESIRHLAGEHITSPDGSSNERQGQFPRLRLFCTMIT